ncbi:hypothetical protein [Mycolicibacterium nivoides]|uniref:hypothetical protein n=1 Tax=Mycolicibacterium nivoides TaxID=2487344 RepID=UPI000F5BC985|nr:hypothetical protein [Mycolicibacterium nivoides]
MSNSRVKWVSPTGFTVMYEHEDGSVSYDFPTERHPQLPREDTSNKGKFGLKGAVQAVMADEDAADALAMAS